MHRRFVVSVGYVCLALFAAIVDAAPKPKRGFVKVLISGQAETGEAEAVADYGRSRLVLVSESALHGMEQRLRARGVQVSRRDDFDILSLPGGRIDVREGLDPSIPAKELISGYGSRRGLHLVQFIGPATQEWMDGLTAAGAEVVMGVPQNGQMVLATSANAANIGRLPFVQFVSPYHPRFKNKPGENEGAVRGVEVEFADFDGYKESLGALRVNDASARELARFANRIVFSANLTDAQIERLLADPLVIGINALPEERISDERQIMSITDNVDLTGYQPTNPQTYSWWLANRCTFCGDLVNENFRIGIADTGLDDGILGSANRHPELAPTGGGPDRISYGAILYPGVTTQADAVGHGTMVAGIIAGNSGLGPVDAFPNFYLGQGVLPSAGIFSTRVTNNSGVLSTSFTPLDYATDATNNGVRFQNHSFNSAVLADMGKYTARCAQVDTAVRDSNGTNPGATPITIAVAAGNRDGSLGPLVSPTGTAKNVITAGGAEDYRTDPYETTPSCRNTATGGFLYLNKYAKRGTAVPNTHWDGNVYPWTTYIKPDLTAPASHISSCVPHVTGYCNGDFYNQPTHHYTMESGTSFAAPVVSGAAALASRVYSQKFLGYGDPTLASPALIKAMLIASARDMMGGTDSDTGLTIGPRPNDMQGFGLVNVTEILDNVPKTFINQSHRFNSSSNPAFHLLLNRRDNTKKVKAALAWTDAPAAAGAIEPLMNNLDLAVNVPTTWLSGGFGSPVTPCSVWHWGNNPAWMSEDTFQAHCAVFYMGQGPDYRNNAELAIMGDPGSRDVVQITITPTAINAQGNPNIAGNNQDFGLYIYNASQRGDFDHDAKAEIVWRHAGAETRPLLWRNLAGTSTQFLAPLAQPWKIVAVGDFDANGSDDYVIHEPTTGAVQVRLMNKMAALSTANLLDIGGSPVILAAPWEIAGAGDIDRDGNVDLVLRNYTTSGVDALKVRFWRMAGTQIYQIADFGGTPPAIDWRLEGVADINMDGWYDFVWHNQSTGATMWWAMEVLKYSGTTTGPTLSAATFRMGGFADYNGDGYNDIVWRRVAGGASTNRLWYGNGGTTWTSANITAQSDANWKIAGPR
jgi:hypothetical protein